MKLSFIKRFLEQHRLYWNVINELSIYSDRERYDIGIDRADMARIAAEAAHGNRAA